MEALVPVLLIALTGAAAAWATRLDFRAVHAFAY